MGLTYDEYIKKKKKEIEERNKKEYEKNAVNVSDIKTFNKKELAPIKQTATQQTKTPKKTTDNRTWFSGGAFEDGYQFGDLTKTVRGTVSDVKQDVAKGILRIGEGLVDTGAYLVGGTANLLGNKELADKTKGFIAKNYVEDSKIANLFANANDPVDLILGVGKQGYKAIKNKDVNEFFNIDESFEKQSVLGDKSDSLVQSAGQLGGTVALQSVGVPWYLTTGVTSFGGETQQAFNQDATYGEAGFSGLITAGAEILTEKISGGIKFGGKTPDDGLQKIISEKITSKFLQKATKLGVDVVGEGSEEVLSELISNLGKKLSYEDEKTWEEMFLSEEAMDAYIESFIGGAVLGGAGSVGQSIMASKQQAVQQAEQELGRTLTTEERTQIEEAVERQQENASNTEVQKDIAPIKEQDALPKSKVRDNDGKLLKVYHGTRADFDTFDTSKAGQNYQNNWSNNGKGIYFTDDKTEAMEFAKSSIDNGDPKVKEAYLDITNPFDSSKDYTNELSDMAKEYGIEPYYLERGDRLFNWFNANNKDIVEALKKYGYDGVVDHGHYTAFDSNQIKSVESNKNVYKEIMEGQETAEDNDVQQDVSYKINSSMTMDEARDMIQRAFVSADIENWTDGQYKTGEEWAKNVDADEIAMYIENDYNLQSKYVNGNPDIVDNELYTIEDIVEAYKNGTLVGKEKAPTQRLDLSKDTGFKDDRFYAPQDIKGDSNLYNVANQRVTNSNRAEVYKARADFIINAHNKGYIDSLGLTQDEVNKKLKSWANYTKKAMDLSNSFNEGVSLQNRWTGIENSSIVNTISISNEEMGKLVKEVKGKSNEWQRQYITSTMLALDTHIDYKNLTFDFEPRVAEMGNNALADYNPREDVIRVKVAGQNTVAHEMGHYLDHLWGREILGNNLGITTRTTNTSNLTKEQKQFLTNFYSFLDSIESSADATSVYKMTPTEVMARFVARFTEWTKNQATNNRYGYEAKWYKDNFTEKQYKEFVKILQEKALLDTTGQTSKVDIAPVKGESIVRMDQSPQETDIDEDILPENNEQRTITKEWTDKVHEQDEVNKPLAIEQAKATGHNTMIGYSPILSNYKLYSKGSLSWVTPDGKVNSKVITETEIDSFLSKNNIDRLNNGINAFENGLSNQLTTKEDIAPIKETESKEELLKQINKARQEFMDYKEVHGLDDKAKELQRTYNKLSSKHNKLFSSNESTKPKEVKNVYKDVADSLISHRNSEDQITYDDIDEAVARMEEYQKAQRQVDEWEENDIPYNENYLEDIIVEIENKITDELNKQGYKSRYIEGKDINVYDQYESIQKGYDEILDYLKESGLNYEISRSTNPGELPSIYVTDEDGSQFRIANHYNGQNDSYYQINNRPYSNNDYINWRDTILRDMKKELTIPSETSIQNDIAPIKQELADLTNELKETIKDTKKELKTLTSEINEVKTAVEEAKAFTEAEASENLRTAMVEDILPTEEEYNANATFEFSSELPEIKPKNDIVNNIKNTFGIKTHEARDLYDTISRKDSVDEVYEALEDYREVTLKEDSGDYKELKNRIRHTKIDMSNLKNEITDYNDFRKSNFGKLRLGNDGQALDVLYEELSGQYPAEFPSEITNPADQLEHLVDFMNKDTSSHWSFSFTDSDLYGLAEQLYVEIGNKERYEVNRKSAWFLGRELRGMKDPESVYGPIASNTNKVQEIAPIKEQVQEVAPIKEQTQDIAPTFKEVVNESEDPLLKAIENQEKRRGAKAEERKAKQQVKLEEDDYNDNHNVAPKKKSIKESASKTWDAFQSHFVNRNRQIDKLSKASGNSEIKFKGDRVNNIAGEVGGDIFTAQTDNYGNVIGKSLDAPFQQARESGLDNYFDNYLKHKSNIERHERGKGSAKVSAKVSQDYVNAYESKYPQFKEWAQDVYKYNQNLLNNAVQNGLIDSNFKDMLTSMYGKYVPFYGDTKAIDPSLYMTPDEIKTSRPIKRAKGGSSANLLGIEQAMIQQTYAYKNAIAKNDLYKEIGKVIDQKVELGADVRNNATDMQSTLYADENGKYLTYYENGQQKTVQINDELYTELSRDLENQIRNLEEKYSLITKPLQKISQLRGQILTTYNVGFVATNPFKDIQDALLNTKQFKGYLKNVLAQSTIKDSVRGKNVNQYAEQFKALTGKDITSVQDASSLKGKAKALYNDYQAGTMWNRFITSYGTNATSMEFGEAGVDVKVKNKGFLNSIEKANNYMEVMFRYPEFKATLESGKSFTEALYNAREVTTNFGRGGTISKAINRNGATFFNTSVQGMDKFFRNFSGENGARGFVGAVSKAVMLGMVPALLNDLLFGFGDDQDEEYEALPDYIKDNYYLFKTSEGNFIRIPKGRMISVLGSSARRTLEMASGEEDAFEGYLKNASDQIGASNPLKENVFSPLIQAYGSENGEAWYGGDLVPTRLQNKPKAEQYDEGTDEFSKWLGEQLNISPYKLNYVIDQYSGGFGDLILPMMTKEANSDGALLAPLKDKFTVNSTDDNKYVGELYDLSEELTIKANGENATEEDKLRNKYLNSIKSQMSELYKEKREIQNSDFSKEAKYAQVQMIQSMINALAKEGLDFYTEIEVTDNYANVGYYEDYYKTSEGEWYSVNEDEIEDLDLMGLTAEEKNSYFGAKNKIYTIKDKYGDSESEDKYTAQKREIIDEIRNTNLTDEVKSYLYDKYYASTDKLNVITETSIPFDVYLDLEYQDFKADKNKYGNSISGSKKAKIVNYIENSGLDYSQKVVLHKMYYPADDDYNYDVVDYIVNNVETYESRINILETLGFKIAEDGTIYWD